MAMRILLQLRTVEAPQFHWTHVCGKERLSQLQGGGGMLEEKSQLCATVPQIFYFERKITIAMIRLLQYKTLYSVRFETV